MNRQTNARQIALCSLMTAGSLAVLWAACAAPSGRIGLAAAAGLFPMAAVLEAGRRAGLMSWGASSALGLILMPDKGLAVLYGMFLGLYPVAKSYLEQIPKPVLSWGGKLIFFNAALTVGRLALQLLLFPEFPVFLVYAGGNLVFLAYDFGLSQLAARLNNKMRK